MTYLGFVRLFSAPLMAFLVSAVIVCAFGYLFYRIGNRKQVPAAAKYWKLLALVAEICVAVGLIGLADVRRSHEDQRRSPDPRRAGADGSIDGRRAPASGGAGQLRAG